MDRNAFIKEQILAGKDREAVRRELISQGESTADLEVTYDALVAQLGVKAPQAPAPTIPEYTQSMYARPKATVVFPSLGTAFRHGFAKTLQHWKEVLLCSLLLFIPVVLFSFVPLSYPPVLIGLSLFSLFISVVGFGILTYALCTSQKKVHPSLSVQWSMSHFLPLLWLVLLVTFVFLGTLIAFVVPFCIFSLYIAFAVPVFVQEDKRGVRALLRSHDLIKGNFFRIGGYVFVVTLVGLLGGLVASLFLMLPLPYVGELIALIMHVFFTGVYLSVIAELYAIRAQDNPMFDLSTYAGMTWLYRFFALIGVVVFCVYGWYVLTQSTGILQNILMQKDTTWELFGEEKEGENTLSEGLVQSKVTTTAASADVFVWRMGFYDGVCDDISVVDPVQCKQTSEAYVIFAPLTQSSFYCIDSSGFSGEVARPKEDRCE